MKIKTINLFLIITIFLSQFNLNLLSDDNTAATIAASAAVGTVAGYGFYKLFSTFSTSSDSLVDEACKELMKAKDYTKQLEVIDKELNGLSNIDKKEEIFSINEDLAEQLAATAPKKVVDQDYLRNLKQNIKNLKYYLDKFPKRIRKLEKKFKNNQKYIAIINDMNELIRRIGILLPNLDILFQYITQHLRYFELDEIMSSISIYYAPQLKLFESKKISANEIIRKVKNRSTNYPLIDFVNGVDNDILRLEKNISKACLKYEELTSDAQSLKRKLSKIKDIIVTDREYFAEQRALERAKAQEAAINGGMFLLGAAAGAITGAAIASTEPKKEVIIIDNNPEYSYEVHAPTDEYIIYE